MTRTCRGCGVEKPLSAYRVRSRDGQPSRRFICRDCESIRPAPQVRISERRPREVGYEGLVRAVFDVPDNQARG